jgi:GNAT superfamily N-acetyltransferase
MSGALAIEVTTATSADAPVVAAILAEVDAWVAQLGTPMWELGEVDHDRVASEVANGLFFLAWCDGEPAGTVKFQLDDPLFWPDRPDDNAAYIHRLAVRRKFAGGRISTALMKWAVDQARALDRDVLRLDCDADRPSLRAVYERFGFIYHSDRQVGPYYVARYEYFLAGPGSGTRDPGSD